MLKLNLIQTGFSTLKAISASYKPSFILLRLLNMQSALSSIVLEYQNLGTDKL